MKASIDVENRKEADEIKLGLSDPSVRAFVRIMGALSLLNSYRSRQRVMTFIKDYFDEADAAATSDKL